MKNSFDKNVRLNLLKPNKDYKTIQKTRFVDQISNYKLLALIFFQKKITKVLKQSFKYFVKKKKILTWF